MGLGLLDAAIAQLMISNTEDEEYYSKIVSVITKLSSNAVNKAKCQHSIMHF